MREDSVESDNVDRDEETYPATIITNHTSFNNTVK